jgi:acetoin utilization deacetylase AcuC-like enzyme
MIIFHDPSCVEYHRTGDPERPARISSSVPLLKERHSSWEWRQPDPAGDAPLLRAHTREHLAHVANPISDFDADTPAHENIDRYARAAAGAAIAAARGALAGQKTFSLMRPPGHHAMRSRAMGFCYFSNIAVAALDVLEQGAKRVAIWDFDAHHGNGTEDIIGQHDQVAFASIHQYPGYPGTGTRSFGHVSNYPMPPYTSRGMHMNANEEGLHTLMDFRPDLLLVSAGFDAFVGDPITQMTLEVEDFATLGSWLSRIDIPAAAILEGGYSDSLPQLIDAFLTGWQE